MRVRIFSPDSRDAVGNPDNYTYKATLNTTFRLDDLPEHEDVSPGDILYAEDWWMLVEEKSLKNLGSSASLTRLYVQACEAETGKAPESEVVSFGTAKNGLEALNQIQEQLAQGRSMRTIALMAAQREIKNGNMVTAETWLQIGSDRIDVTGKEVTKQWLLYADPAVLRQVATTLHGSDDDEISVAVMNDIMQTWVMLFSTDMGSPGEMQIGQNEMLSRLLQFGHLCTMFSLIRAGLAEEGNIAQIWSPDWSIKKTDRWGSMEEAEEILEEWIRKNTRFNIGDQPQT